MFLFRSFFSLFVSICGTTKRTVDPFFVSLDFVGFLLRSFAVFVFGFRWHYLCLPLTPRDAILSRWAPCCGSFGPNPKGFVRRFEMMGFFFFATCSLRFDSIAISILFLSWREWTRESRAKSMASNRRTKGVYIFFFLKKILQKKSLLTSSSVDLVDILHARSEANKDLPSPINRLAHPHLGPRKREREREKTKSIKLRAPNEPKTLIKT